MTAFAQVPGPTPSRDDRPTAAVWPMRAAPEGGGDAAGGFLRLAVHLTLAGLPLLAISAHVFGLLPMHLAAALVVLPLTVAAGLLAMFDPLLEERIVWRGAVWGAFATLVYDVFRLDTVYLLGWWGDFIPTMGTWVIGADPGASTAGAVAGYLWRYVGDGPGIGIVFFVLAAATGLRRLGRWPVVGVAVAFAVFPVWAGLIATVGLAPRGQELMFALTPTTLTLSLVGHLIFGLVLGLGCARTPDLERLWPHPLLLDPEALLARLRGDRPVSQRALPALPRPVAPPPFAPQAVVPRPGPPELPAAPARPRVCPVETPSWGPRGGSERSGPAVARSWWDEVDASGGPGWAVPPPGPAELTMPVPPPRPPTPPRGLPVAGRPRW